VTLRAERDLLLVVTACSVDYYVTNGGVCTEIEVEITPSGRQRNAGSPSRTASLTTHKDLLISLSILKL
jgi:uncharacterized protein YcgI (DUF1989 family)